MLIRSMADEPRPKKTEDNYTHFPMSKMRNVLTLPCRLHPGKIMGGLDFQINKEKLKILQKECTFSPVKNFKKFILETSQRIFQCHRGNHVKGQTGLANELS